MKRFVLLSLFLHALFAVAWQYAGPQEPVLLTVRTLTLLLPSPGEQTQTTSSRPEPQSSPTREISAQELPRPQLHKKWRKKPAENRTASSKALQQPPAPDADVDIADVKESDSRTVQSNVRAAVYSALQASFSYPRRARIRGWEGTVVIALRILPDGAVANVRVSGSSGISVLDNAAMRSIKAVHVPQVVAWMNGRKLDMFIPIEYRLTDS